MDTLTAHVGVLQLSILAPEGGPGGVVPGICAHALINHAAIAKQKVLGAIYLSLVGCHRHCRTQAVTAFFRDYWDAHNPATSARLLVLDPRIQRWHRR